MKKTTRLPTTQIQVYTKITRKDLHRSTENNWQASPARVVRRRIHEFPSAYDHSTVLGLYPVYSDTKLAGCQISKLIHLHTTREIQVRFGCLPVDLLFSIDSLLHGTLFDSESRDKTSGKTLVSGSPTQTRDTEKRACNRRNRDDRNRGRHH